MRYFVFVDTPYYPYVDEPVEADSIEEARAKVAATLTPGGRETIYLAPAAAVETVSMEGPKPEPQGLLKLLTDSNRFHEQLISAKAISGGFSVSVQGGTTMPPASFQWEEL